MSEIQKIESTQDLGLNTELINELILKAIYVNGALLGKEISSYLKTSFSIIEELLLDLKKRELIIVIGAESVLGGYHGMKFDLTIKGRERSKEIMSVRSYTGAIPVTFSDYALMIDRFKLGERVVGKEIVDDLFKDIIIEKRCFDQIGPGVNSGGPLLIYGKPGNGKTMIAERIINVFQDHIYVPHCLMIDGQFIKYFDDKIHEVISYDTPDPRWVKIKRPYVVVGGELTLDMLDLTYKQEFKYYEAPLQLKANGGVLLIDDFGRQLISPKELLNRWIYPLEKKIDYLTLVTGKKIEVPFEQMIIFSSNLRPKDLGDDAFLRRIKYKIQIPSPTLPQFKQIFLNECQSNDVEFSDNAFKYLIIEHYQKRKRSLRGCHSRDIIQHIADYISYHRIERKLSKVNIDFACNSYFTND